MEEKDKHLKWRQKVSEEENNRDMEDRNSKSQGNETERGKKSEKW